jgi:hypothetical protein
MTPNEKGRFCNACSKTIVDFSYFTDKEIIKAISSGETCGKFKKSQLNRTLRTQSKKSLFLKTQWLIALLAPTMVKAVDVPIRPSIAYNKAQNNVVSEPKNRTILITGSIVDANTGESIIAANIRVNTPFSGTSSDVYGSFSLLCETNKDTLWLNISHLGYKNTKVEVPLTSSIVELSISLNPKETGLDEICIEVDREHSRYDDIMGILITTKVEPTSVFKLGKRWRRLKESIRFRREIKRRNM